MYPSIYRYCYKISKQRNTPNNYAYEIFYVKIYRLK